MLFDDLRARYLENRLVVFVGAGVSAAGGLPSWSGLIQRVLADARAAAASASELRALDEAEAALTRGDLLRALGEIQTITTSAVFGHSLSRALDDSHHPVPALAQAIASLAPTLHAVVTTNLDRFLERAFAGNWPSFTLPHLDLGQQKHYILQLHGNRIDRSSWVLSEREYEDLLHGRPELQRFVEGLFRFHTLLFVGYGMHDPDFDRLCGQLRVVGRGQAPQHFALMPEGKVGNYERLRLAEAGVELLTYRNPDGSHAELLRIIEDLAASQPGAATLTSATSGRTVAAPSATPTVTPREALCGLLRSVFNPSELRGFVTDLAGHTDLASRLPGQGTSLAELVLETALLLERHGLLAVAFARISTDYPRRVAEVEKVAAVWGIRPAFQPPAPSRFSLNESPQGAMEILHPQLHLGMARASLFLEASIHDVVRRRAEILSQLRSLLCDTSVEIAVIRTGSVVVELDMPAEAAVLLQQLVAGGDLPSLLGYKVLKVHVLSPRLLSEIKVLFLAANPRDTTPIDFAKEASQVESELSRCMAKTSYQFIPVLAATFFDLQRRILDLCPHFIHVSSHGSDDGALLLHREDGSYGPVPPAAAVQLFAGSGQDVRCILLNACHSHTMAKKLSATVSCTIGMKGKIDDSAAIDFARSFYMTAFRGRSILEAHAAGLASLALHPGNKAKAQLFASLVDPSTFKVVRAPL